MKIEIAILLGVALGAIPTRKLSDIMVAWLSKKAGVKPEDIRAYDKATSNNETQG